MTETASRDEFAPGLDLAPDDERDHGTDADPTALAGRDRESAQAYLAELSLPERLEVLFGIEPFDYQRALCRHVDGDETARVAIQPGRQVGKTLIGAALAEPAVRHR